MRNDRSDGALSSLIEDKDEARAKDCLADVDSFLDEVLAEGLGDGLSL
jgi:hypothetical protein